MTGFKMLVHGVEAGGKGEVPTFLWGQIVGDVAETLTVRDLTAVAVLPEGQRSSSDLSRWWSRPAGYKDCFQLLWSVCVSRSGSTNTIRAPEEIITAAGTVSAPELGAGEWWSSFMKVPIVPSVGRPQMLCWSKSILFRDHLSSPFIHQMTGRGASREMCEG